MFNMLKRYTFNQYLAGASIILFLISSVTSIRMEYDEVIVLKDVLYNMLAVAFCVISIIKGDKVYLGNKPLSFILLAMGIIEFLSMKDGTIWLIIPLFYILAAFTLSNKFKNNIVTILLGIVSINGNSLLLANNIDYIDKENFLYLILLGKGVLFLCLVFLLIYECSIKKSSIEQSHESSIGNQLKDLRELLVEEYITKEEFDAIKNSIINIHKI